MTEIMPQEEMAAFVRGVLEAHDEWDSMHQLMILDWDGEKITCDTLFGIDPRIEPSEYPVMLPALAAKQLDEQPDTVPYAYLLQFEGWRAQGDGPPPSERPDRVEVAIAVAVDVEGRLWSAQKRRDHPGEIDEYFVEPGGTVQADGNFTEALMSMAARARYVRTSMN